MLQPILIDSQEGGKADTTAEKARELIEENVKEPSVPPKATLARRAQSYSDFYAAVKACSRKAKRLERKRSLDDQSTSQAYVSPDLAVEEEYDAYENDLLDASYAEYDTYHEQLKLSQVQLDNLLASTSSTLGILSSLSSSFEQVELQTEVFRKQCEGLITEQKRVQALADGIEENARYYTYLEPMTRRLNAPGAGRLVNGREFPEMLNNLDNCLAYMESHPNHKESANYRTKYRLLLTRALTLIRQHFTQSLRQIAQDVSQRISAGQLKDATQSALLYAKFRVPAPEMKQLALEIRKRAVPTPDDVDAGREPEYAGLMRELYQSYSATRGRLVLPLVSKRMAELAAVPSSGKQVELLTFARTSIGYVRGICLDEYDLWQEWFVTDGALYDFLEALCEPLYDYLRPKIIHETRLEKLCELCAMIQGRYMEQDSEEEEDIMSPANGKPPGATLDFANIVQPALEDAQTRLVFLALAVLRDDIEYYKPKPEDLAIPDQRRSSTTDANGTKKEPVLSGTRTASISNTPGTPMPKTPVVVDQDADGDDESMFRQRFGAKSDKDEEKWYPTLRKAVWLLRRIYRLVNSTVFDDLAHRVVHSTTYSLIQASQQLTQKSSAADGQLFFITHLLHFKQQIVAFDIEYVTPEVGFDFSSMTNTFYELRDRGSLWNPMFWARLASGAVSGGLLPKVVENMLDAKVELDGRLRAVINDFVIAYAGRITAPVTVEEQSKLSFDALKAVRTVRGLAEKVVPALRAKLEDFVADMRTRETLVAAVRDQVNIAYEEFFERYSEGKGRRLSRKGKGRADDVWGPDLFGEAMERVFAVGNVIGEDGNESEGSGAASD